MGEQKALPTSEMVYDIRVRSYMKNQGHISEIRPNLWVNRQEIISYEYVVEDRGPTAIRKSKRVVLPSGTASLFCECRNQFSA